MLGRSIFAVASDKGPASHREIISNWDGSKGNSIFSVFLGLTKANTVRFSDAFNSAGLVVDRRKPFLLTAINGDSGANVYQGMTPIGTRGQTITSRRLDTAWVIGQQGTIDGEYWNGDIAELLVYDRELNESERVGVWKELIARYKLTATVDQHPKVAEMSARLKAMASLCHVLLNSNEFLYVD